MCNIFFTSRILIYFNLNFYNIYIIIYMLCDNNYWKVYCDILTKDKYSFGDLIMHYKIERFI